MAGVVMCEPFELYNLLNQGIRVSRLSEINYLCLVDAREAEDYGISHIVTAKTVKTDSDGDFLLPENVEVDSMQHIVVYDGSTSSLQEGGRAAVCAGAFAKVSLYPVRIVSGGFQRFSALYPFLRTEKILYTITELENLKTYPVEVIAGRLYVGNQDHSVDSSILRNLKIRAVISISDTLESVEGVQDILNIPVADSAASDLYSSFERICCFIDSHINMESRVLIVSVKGTSCCGTVTIAFLLHHFRYTLEEAWKYMLKCKPNTRPNRGFLQQLSEWEQHTTGSRQTDISSLHL
ncbi:uncharacterized protein V6R79_007912 [Siganus canaliculatus]